MCEPPGVRRLVLLALVLGAGLALPAPAPAQAPTPPPTHAPGEALLELCRASGLPDIPELGPRVCASFEAGSTLLAQICGQLPIPAEACANLTDGNLIDPARVDAFERSWVWRALRLQDRLDDRQPLRQSLWPHTHNSFNSAVYSPTLSDIDPNQRYSLLDQLRMGIRAVELDVHWAPSLTGSAATGGRAVVLCHGQTAAVGDLSIHVGCSVDRPLADGLRELRSFLDAPGNEREVVLLYLENNLDDDPQAHALTAAALASELGDLVVRPPVGEPCAEMPMDQSTDDLRASGGRILIVGNCGPGEWGTWVHERGPRWDESGSGGGYPAFPACIDAERVPGDYDARWSRIYEDSTWLSAIANGGRTPLLPADVVNMVRCGVDMVGFDRLEPDDGRLEALVWSWAPDEPADDAARRCVGGDADGRFRMAPCGEARRFACLTPSQSWVVPDVARPATDAAEVCATAGAVPATPPTGWENERLRAASAGEPVWLSLTAADVGFAADTGGAGDGDVPVAPAVAPTGFSRSLPATGGGQPVGWAYGLVGFSLATAAMRRRRRRL